jgi:transposase
MTGPGEYTADVTEGITRVEDLPEPKIIQRRRSFKRRKCPHCGHSAYRDKVFTRRLHDLGDLAANRPKDLVVTYSQHCCSHCRTYFNVDLSRLGCSQQPLHASGRRPGGTAGGRGRPAVSVGFLAFVA